MADTKVKLCGIRRDADVDLLNELRPAYTGFIFHPQSHRYLTMQQALHFRRNLDPDILAVGVFYNAKIEEVIRIARSGAVDLLQLHGNENEAYLKAVRHALTKDPGQSRTKGALPIIKTFQVQAESDLEDAAASTAEYIMLDAAAGGGVAFDWEIAAKSPLLDLIREKMFFAGGLSAENIGEAIRLFDPFAVDVSSSLETDGYKDEEKCRAFMRAVELA